MSAPASRGGATRALRHGVFLRPGPSVAARTLEAFAVCERQFGFTAAGAYPPHVTILGSIDLVVEEGELVSAVESALAGARPMSVRVGPLQLDAHGTYLGHPLGQADGAPLTALMGRVLERVDPLRTIRDGDFSAEARRADSPETYTPHLTVLGHDGAERPDELPDVLAFLGALGLDEPVEEVWDAVSLYRFASDDWQGRYWQTMTWEIVRTWHLSP